MSQNSVDNGSLTYDAEHPLRDDRELYRVAGGVEGADDADDAVGLEGAVEVVAAGADAGVEAGALSPEPLAGAAAAGAASEPDSPLDGAGGFAEP